MKSSVMWQVDLKKHALKQCEKLPKHIIRLLRALVREMRIDGPLRHNWRNFGKLKGFGERYHCHIKSGKPTYVVCWEVVNKKVKIVEIYYVGTHENTPY